MEYKPSVDKVINRMRYLTKNGDSNFFDNFMSLIFNQPFDLPENTVDFESCCCAIYYAEDIPFTIRVMHRVLKPGGVCIVAFARTAVPTKAIAIWRHHGDGDRARLVELYFSLAEGFGDAETVEVGDKDDPRTKANVVFARRLP